MYLWAQFYYADDYCYHHHPKHLTVLTESERVLLEVVNTI